MVVPQVCTIAGSDSGGGAGIQADLKTFQEREVFGTSVVVAVTAQNTYGVHQIAAIPVANVTAQLEAVFSDFHIGAVKTGMLGSQAYIDLVADFLQRHPTVPVVVDPVMVAKGGASLLAAAAVTSLKKLLPLATLVTPNLPEAEALTGFSINDDQTRIQAALVLQNLGAKNVLIKGGHGDEVNARDLLLLADGQRVWFEAPRVETRHTHGTGCTLSACITAELGKGASVLAAVTLGKDFITAAISDELGIGGGHGPTNHWAYRKRREGDGDGRESY